MTASLYSMDVLRLAASVAEFPPLADAAIVRELRSPTCGSRVSVTLTVDEVGRIDALGIDARACALGQAAAALFARHAVGRSAEEIAAASRGWRAYLAGESEILPEWPGLEALAPGRDYPARHPSMRLAFEAAAEALAGMAPHG